MLPQTADIPTENAVASLKYPVDDKGHSGPKGTGKGEPQAQFCWFWEESKSLHTLDRPAKANIRAALCEYRCRCTCRLCNRHPNIQSQSSGSLDPYDVDFLPLVPIKTEDRWDHFFGGFDMLFDGHPYVATIIDLVSEGVVRSPRAPLLFHDPLSAHWRFGDEIYVEDLEANASEKRKVLDASDINSHPCHACAADPSANRLPLRRKQDEQMSQTD